jgi:hypothetical protein
VNFATSKNLIVKSTTFPHRNIHKYTWTSTDGITYYQIDHVLVKKHDGTIVADTISILSRWEQFFSNLLNVNQSTSHEGSEVYTA